MAGHQSAGFGIGRTKDSYAPYDIRHGDWMLRDVFDRRGKEGLWLLCSYGFRQHCDRQRTPEESLRATKERGLLETFKVRKRNPVVVHEHKFLD